MLDQPNHGAKESESTTKITVYPDEYQGLLKKIPLLKYVKHYPKSGLYFLWGKNAPRKRSIHILLSEILKVQGQPPLFITPDNFDCSVSYPLDGGTALFIP